MDTITLTYHNNTVALATPRRFWLAAHIEALPNSDPTKRLIAFMALYAREVLTGDLPGPYTDQRALTFARLALLDPARDAAQRHRGDDELAAALQLPVTEILAVHREQQPHDDRSARPRHRYQPPTAAGPTEVGPTPPCRAAQRRGRARWR